MSRAIILTVASSALAIALTACNDATVDLASVAPPRQYGATQKVGNGTVQIIDTVLMPPSMG